MGKPSLAVIIPLFNERENLPELRSRLCAVLESTGTDYRVVLVDDGSDDGSFEAMRSVHQADPRWKAIRLSRNFGHGAACTAGLQHVDADAVILMDGDLQDPPELIPEMLKMWRGGVKVVYAIRTGRKDSWLRRTATAAFYRALNRLSAVAIPVDAGIFSLLDRQAALALSGLGERHRYLTGLRAWIGFTQGAVPYERQERHASTPKQTLARLLLLALDALFAFSVVPLRAASVLGVLMAGASIAFAAKVCYEKLFTDKPIIGWTSTIMAITLTGGMILTTLGIIGEYLSRIFDEVKQRPIYLVDELLGLEGRAPRRS